MKKLLAILLCLALVVGCFAGCGQSAGSGTTFRKMYSGEVTTMNYLVTGSTNDLIIPANVIDTLVEYDAYGAIKPALAESWETSEDGLTWTFHLREGVKWYDYTGKEVAPVTAQDFVDAAIYALDAKNASSTEYMMEGIIANATEYYKYTCYLLESENGTKTTDEDGEAIEPVAEVKPEDVGVKAVDDLTLEYTLVQPTPYFLSVLNYGCYLPANGAFMQSCIAEDGTDMFGTDNTKLLYNGAYILSTFEPQGRRIMTKNPNYWDKDNVFIDAIEETYNKEMDTIAPEMFKRNETDLAYLSADILDAWLAADDTKNMVSPSRVDSSYSYFYAFNFEPKFDEAYEPDNWTLAVNNENFRQSIFHALDRVKAKTVMQPYDPESFIINTVTPPNFTDLNGVDFSEVGDLAAISARDSFQSDKALEYKEKAVEELTAEGATFPVKVLMPYNPSSTNWDKECQVVEQQLEGLLGSDYIDVIVEAGPSTGFLSEVRRGGKFALMKCNWGADYADPATWTEPFSDTGSDSYLHWRADTAAGVRDIIAEYDALVAEAKAQVEDMSVRYNTFAQAEASIINHAVIIPYGVEGDGFKATRLNELEAEYAPYGLARQRYKYQKLRTEPMSQNEFNTLYEAWQAERAKALAAE